MNCAEQIRLWLSALGPVVTAIGFAFLYKQLQVSTQQAKTASDSYLLAAKAAERAATQAAEQQKWKKAEFLANQVKDFFGDETVERTIYMLDWHIRKLVIDDDSEEKVLTLHDEKADAEAEQVTDFNDNFLRKDRSVVISKALRKHDKDSRFTELEALVRDNFDWLFFRLGQFQHMIQSDLFTYDEVDVHLSYVLDLISGGLHNVSEEVTKAIAIYVSAYDFPAIVTLIACRVAKRAKLASG